MSNVPLSENPTLQAHIAFAIFVVVVLLLLFYMLSLAAEHCYQVVCSLTVPPDPPGIIKLHSPDRQSRITTRRCPVWEHVALGDLHATLPLLQNMNDRELFQLELDIPFHLGFLWDKYDIWNIPPPPDSAPHGMRRKGLAFPGLDFESENKHLPFKPFTKEDGRLISDWRVVRQQILDQLSLRRGKSVIPPSYHHTEVALPEFHFYIGQERHYGLPLTRRPTHDAKLLWFFMQNANFADDEAARLFSQDPHLRRCLENANDNELDRILQFVPAQIDHMNSKCVFTPKWIGSDKAYAYNDFDFNRTFSNPGRDALSSWRHVRFDILREQRQRPCNRKFGEHTTRFRQKSQWLSEDEKQLSYPTNFDVPIRADHIVAGPFKTAPCHPSNFLPSPRERPYAEPGYGSLVSYDGGFGVSYGNMPANPATADELRQFLLSGGQQHAC